MKESDVFSSKATCAPSSSVEAQYARVKAEFGSLNIVVNNAAVQYPKDDVQEITAQQLKNTFETNIYPFFFIVQEALSPYGQGRLHHQYHLCHCLPRQRTPVGLLQHQRSHSLLYTVHSRQCWQKRASGSTVWHRARYGHRLFHPPLTRWGISVRIHPWEGQGSPQRWLPPMSSWPARTAAISLGR